MKLKRSFDILRDGSIGWTIRNADNDAVMLTGNAPTLLEAYTQVKQQTMLLQFTHSAFAMPQ